MDVFRWTEKGTQMKNQGYLNIEYSLPVTASQGFAETTELCPKTVVEAGIELFVVDVQHTKVEIPATMTTIRIGEDYQGATLPQGTEVVQLIDYTNGQLVQYQHRALGKSEKFSTFKQEVLSSEQRKSLDDFVIMN